METLGSPTKPVYSGSDSHTEQKTTNMHLTDKCGSHRGLQRCHMTGLFDSSAGYRFKVWWKVASTEIPERKLHLCTQANVKHAWSFNNKKRYLLLSYFNIIVLLMLHSYNGVKLGYTFYDQKEIKLLPHCRNVQHKSSFWYYAVFKTCKKVLKQAQSPGGSQLRWNVNGHVFLCADVNKVVVAILWHLTYSTVDEQVETELSFFKSQINLTATFGTAHII